MFRLRASLAILISVFFLGGCSMYYSAQEIEALNQAEPVGSPFTKKLAEEYRVFANREHDNMFDYPDSLHFARKGLAAAAGELVMPEPLSNWNVSDEHIPELAEARSRLMSAFDKGGREFSPETSAIAQVSFDCWVEQQEESFSSPDVESCKSQFKTAMQNLSASLASIAQPDVINTAVDMPAVPVETEIVYEEEAPPPAAQSTALDQAMYLVFFDFNGSSLEDSAHDVLDAVHAETQRYNIDTITITGHTDSSGSKTYNERLSLRRADAVRQALIEHGVNPGIIAVESRGEDDLLIDTADNVREPANRRVEIRFR